VLFKLSIKHVNDIILTSKSSILATFVDLSDGDYELSLTDFKTYYTIPNVNSSNNEFYFDKNNKKIVIPEGSYELHDIDKYLKRVISNNIMKKKTHRKNEDDENEYPLIIRANNNMMKSEIKCAYQIKGIGG